jgi:hypothetical protein
MSMSMAPWCSERLTVVLAVDRRAGRWSGSGSPPRRSGSPWGALLTLGLDLTQAGVIALPAIVAVTAFALAVGTAAAGRVMAERAGEIDPERSQ